MTITESYRILSDLGEDFETEPFYRYAYHVFNWESFNLWLLRRYRFIYKFTEDFLTFINPTKLYHKKLVEALDREIMRSKWYLQPKYEYFEWEKTTEYVSYGYDLNNEFMVWEYMTLSGEHRLDIEIFDGIKVNDYLKLLEIWISESINVHDYYLTDLVTLKETPLKIREFLSWILVRWVHIYENLVLRDDYQASPSIIMEFFDLSKTYTTLEKPIYIDYVDIRCVYPEPEFMLPMTITEVYLHLPEIVRDGLDSGKLPIVVEPSNIIKENYDLSTSYVATEPQNIVKTGFEFGGWWTGVDPKDMAVYSFDITTVYDTTFFIMAQEFDLFVPYVALVGGFVLDFDLTKSTGVEPLEPIGFDSDVFTKLYTHAEPLFSENFNYAGTAWDSVISLFDNLRINDSIGSTSTILSDGLRISDRMTFVEMETIVKEYSDTTQMQDVVVCELSNNYDDTLNSTDSIEDITRTVDRIDTVIARDGFGTDIVQFNDSITMDDGIIYVVVISEEFDMDAQSPISGTATKLDELFNIDRDTSVYTPETTVEEFIVQISVVNASVATYMFDAFDLDGYVISGTLESLSEVFTLDSPLVDAGGLITSTEGFDTDVSAIVITVSSIQEEYLIDITPVNITVNNIVDVFDIEVATRTYEFLPLTEEFFIAQVSTGISLSTINEEFLITILGTTITTVSIVEDLTISIDAKLVDIIQLFEGFDIQT